MLAALKAGPKTVDLRQLASHYYEFAARVMELFEEEEIVDVLSEVRGIIAWPTRSINSRAGLRLQAWLERKSFGADVRRCDADIQRKGR